MKFEVPVPARFCSHFWTAQSSKMAREFRDFYLYICRFRGRILTNCKNSILKYADRLSNYKGNLEEVVIGSTKIDITSSREKIFRYVFLL